MFFKMPPKFDTICKEFGGEISSDFSLRPTVAYACSLNNYDDFKSFIQWMNHQKKNYAQLAQLKRGERRIMPMPYMGKYVDESSGWFAAKFILDEDSKTVLWVSNKQAVRERNAGSYQGPTGWVDGFRTTPNEFVLSKAEEDEIIGSKISYLNARANFDADECRATGHFNVVADVSVEIDGPVLPVLKELDEAVRGMTSKVAEIVTEKISKFAYERGLRGA